jgi:hypothetical protein
MKNIHSLMDQIQSDTDYYVLKGAFEDRGLSYAYNVNRKLHYDLTSSFDDVIKNCMFDKKDCTDEKRFSVFPHRGQCHTFNKDGSEEVLSAGTNFGLKLVLNLNKSDSFGGIEGTNGFKILIHEAC